MFLKYLKVSYKIKRMKNNNERYVYTYKIRKKRKVKIKMKICQDFIRRNQM